MLKRFLNSDYHIEVKKFKSTNDQWDSEHVEIYHKYIKIGEYTRNYPSCAEDTFFPFRLNNKDYALYSKDYMYSAVMSLPDCKTIWSENSIEYNQHFCPAEFYVPRYFIDSFTIGDKVVSYNAYLDYNNDDSEGKDIHYTKFGLVSGCKWGDDTHYKVELIDFSKIEDGIITRSNIFGYCELPNLPLGNCVAVRDNGIEIATIKFFSMKTE